MAFGSNKPDPTALFKVPCQMCGNELRLQRIDFGEMVVCPHCGDELVLQEKDAELIEDRTLRANVMFPTPPAEAQSSDTDQPVGDCSANRYFAAAVDQVGASIASVVVATTFLSHLHPVVQGIAGVGVYFLYFFLSEGLATTTPGKYFYNLHVVNRDGQKPSWIQIAIRTAWRLIEFNPLLIGGLPAGVVVFATATHQRIGDKQAGTYVVFKD